MERSFYFVHYMLGQALELKGQLPEAVAEYQQAIKLNDDPFPKALLGHLLGKMGRKDEARRILQELRQIRGQRYFEAYGLALLCLGLDDRDEALRWLEQGYRDHDGFNMGPIRLSINSSIRCMATRVSKRSRNKSCRRGILPSLCQPRNEFAQLLRRIEAAQCLQGRGGLRGRCVAAHSGRFDSLPHL